MARGDWSVYHSRLSFTLNSKLLSPLEVVNAAISYWEQHQDHITLPQIEGFVRQIIGWREFMRGIYWAHMPHYAELNALNHHTPLPAWFWTGETKMNCLHQSLGQSLEYAYAHHIQRLMVIGNFALLAGISPNALDAWYLGVYMDAIEWVEITNTRGMSQYADGGIVGSKPYAASANYIQKMSDYCKTCQYDAKVRVGPTACPFNALYWNFYARHEDRFRKNPRIGMMYQTWGKMDKDTQESIRQQASSHLANLDTL
jgi:deoxyribodipyrimidine photolyase-related protein